MRDITQESPGLFAFALIKPPSLSPTPSPHTVGTVAYADSWGAWSPGSLVSALEYLLHCRSGEALVPFQRSDPLSWGDFGLDGQGQEHQV